MLAHDFAHLRCDACAQKRLLALSCKGGGVSPLVQDRVLRLFVRYRLLDPHEAADIRTWRGTGGFSLDGSGRVEAHDRAEARALLLDLESAFEESLGILAWVINVREGRARQAERLLEGPAAFPDEQSLNTALNQVFLGCTTVNLPTGAHTTYLSRASAIGGAGTADPSRFVVRNARGRMRRTSRSR